MPSNKPRAGVKIATYTLPAYLKDAPRGILLAPASQWADPSKIVDAMATHKVKGMDAQEAYNALLQVFNALNKANSTLISAQVMKHAGKCAEYARTPQFRSGFIEAFSSKKLILEKMELQHDLDKLVTRSVHTAVNITEGALSTVEQSSLERLKGKYRDSSSCYQIFLHESSH